MWKYNSGWRRVLSKQLIMNLGHGARSCDSKVCQCHACLHSRRPPETTWQTVSLTWNKHVLPHLPAHFHYSCKNSTQLVLITKRNAHPTTHYKTAYSLNSRHQQEGDVPNSSDMSQSKSFRLPGKQKAKGDETNAWKRNQRMVGK